MPPINPYHEGTPTREQGGRQSVVVSDVTLPYSDNIIKAVHFNTGGGMTGFKEKDDTGGTARNFTGNAGGYVLGPFAEITTAPADAILEFD